jgi:hypothetical protein
MKIRDQIALGDPRKNADFLIRNAGRVVLTNEDGSVPGPMPRPLDVQEADRARASEKRTRRLEKRLLAVASRA